MMRCPTCLRTYPDETIKFCRVDGATLETTSAAAAESLATRLLAPRATNEAPTAILDSTSAPIQTTSKLAATAAQLDQPAATVRSSHAGPVTNKRGRKAAAVVIMIGLALVALIVVLCLAGLFVYRRTRNTNVAAIDSIAVLPFVNQNHDPDAEYLSDGVTESIINSLTQVQNLRVIPRSSVFHYKGKETDPLAVGKELGVRAVLTGRITQRGDTVTVSAELIDVRDNRQLWGEQYERKASELMSLQRDIAGQIANNLRLTISGETHNRMMKHYTDNPEAYQLYLKGRFYWNQRTGEALKKSIEYFNQAIEKDPSYALAYAGLGDAYSLLPGYGGGSPLESFPKAEAAARRAVELDDTLAEAHTSLSQVLIDEWNLPDSNREAQRAIALNPNYATAHHWYGCNNLLVMGRFDEAIAEGKRAQELDPLSLIINADLGYDYIYARRYDQAIEQLRKTIEMDHSFYYAHRLLGIAYELKGSLPEALAEYQKARQLSDDPLVLAMLGHFYAASGRRAEALKTINELTETARQRYVSAYSLAIIYAGLGEQDQALNWLEKGYQERATKMAFLKIEPFFDSIRSDPRFADLVRRVGLPQ